MAKIINEHLEDAILNLPQKEKNKLLLRLIRKDKLLTEQLHFKLLEHPEIDLKLRENDILEQIESDLNADERYSFGNLLYVCRRLFAQISHHEKVTADKVGELRLSIKIFVLIIKKYAFVFSGIYTNDQVKLNNFLIKKIPALIKKFNKIHEDFKIEFADDLNVVLAFLYAGSNKYYLNEKGVPTEV